MKRKSGGVPEILDVWKTEGLKEPIVEETFGTEIGDRTKVTLPLAKKDHDDYHQDHHQGGKDGGEKGVDWQSRSESILSLIRDNPSKEITQR